MKISVVVPVRNEEDSVCALLDGLINQTRKPDEIVITDGGSTDKTVSIIEEYIERGAPVRLVREGVALPGRGRNLAAERAASEWIAFTDAGIRPANDWLAQLAERAGQDASADVVYGAWEPVADSFFKECAAIAYVPPPAESEGTYMRPRFIASALMRRSVWRAVGGFPEHLRSAEDILFMDKVKEANFRTVYAPRAVVHWNIQPNLWRTFKRFLTYSRHNLRAGLGHAWQAAIFKRYALVLLCALPALFLGLRWWLIATLGLWLLMLFARSLLSLWRNRRSYPASLGRNALRLFVLVPIIAALDAAAFAGTVNWLIKDRLRKRDGRNAEGSGDGA
jgi:glycosyltransferase involved in cell wall biosynthesis